MPIDDKPVYVTLDAMVPTKSGDSTLLVRKVKQEYLAGTVNDLVQKILDPEADSLNVSYNAEEHEVVDIVSEWFREMGRDPDNYRVVVSARDDSGERVPLDLDTRVSDYDSIVRRKEDTDDSTGAKTNYHLIEMLMQRVVPSGKTDDETRP